MVLSCDIGTSSLKTGIIDRDGGLRWFTRMPSYGADASAWFASFVRTVRSAPRDLRRAVEAVALSGHGPTLVPVDGSGRPVAPALMWNDEPDPAEYSATSPFFLPKVLRFQREQPRRYEKTVYFLPAGEYLAFRLSGLAAAVMPHEGFVPYYWNTDELRSRNLDPEKMPPLRLLGEAAGTVTRTMARLLGIRPGITAYGCGVDFLMAILGSGAFQPGMVCDRGGTTEALNLCWSGPLDAPGLRTVPGFLKNTYTIGGFVPHAGKIHAWLKNTLLGSRASYREFDSFAEKAEPGCGGVRFRLPAAFCRVGDERKIKLSDFYYGPEEGIGGPAMARAFMEYLGCRVRSVFERFEATGAILETIRCTGGLSASGTLTRIKAVVSGRVLSLPRLGDAELLGNALTAWWAAGEYGSPEEGAAALFRVREECVPDKRLAAVYESLYSEYVSMSEANQKEAAE